MRKLILFMLASLFASHTNAQQLYDKIVHPHKIITSVSLSKTACLGTCPVYEIQIAIGGYIIYNGIEYVKDTGIYFKKIQPERITSIVNDVEKYRIDTCRKQYTCDITDHASMIITIDYEDNTKTTVEDYAGSGPEFLDLIAKEIDKIGNKVDNVGWKKKRD